MISQEVQIDEPPQLKKEDKWLENWDEWSPKREKMTEFEKGETSNAKRDEKQQPQLFMKLFSVWLWPIPIFAGGDLLNVLLYCYKMMHLSEPKHLVIFGNSNLLGEKMAGLLLNSGKRRRPLSSWATWTNCSTVGMANCSFTWSVARRTEGQKRKRQINGQ
ncbi:hypothetical protein niasHS_002831 [Heterodera schachtii]|uniref:Uncharacterized protein n=1 Tax=Heterodera schachtii TaxID=97005 RepID=A0ABD2K2K0_HETSC